MLDYWRNEDRSLTLGWNEDFKDYYFDSDYGWDKVTKKDLENLRNSINLLLEDK